MLGFTYNGIHSSTYSIVAKSVDRPILPTLRTRQLEIPGRNGVYDFEDNTYENRPIQIDLQYVGTSFSELRTRARQISAWLAGINGAQRLVFDDEPDKYYMAKLYSEVGLSNVFKLGTATLQFECEPFAYYMVSTGEDVTWSSDLTWDSEYVTWETYLSYTFDVTADTTATFTNYGTYTVRPIFEITGSFTDFTITQGTSTLTYNEAITGSQTLTIDCDNYVVDLDGTNKISEISGSESADFVTLTTGSNTLIFSGTSVDVSVTVDFTARYL